MPTDAKKSDPLNQRIKVRPTCGGEWLICDTWIEVGEMLERQDGEYEFAFVEMSDAEVDALGEFGGW